MGCAVIWSYVELFGTRRLKQAVFVDQAPLQDPKPDWNLGSKGNPAELARDMQQGTVDMAAVAAGNANSCLSLELPRDVQQLLERETLQCDAKTLGALMADHTQVRYERSLLHVNTLPSQAKLSKATWSDDHHLPLWAGLVSRCGRRPQCAAWCCVMSC